MSGPYRSDPRLSRAQRAEVAGMYAGAAVEQACRAGAGDWPVRVLVLEDDRGGLATLPLATDQPMDQTLVVLARCVHSLAAECGVSWEQLGDVLAEVRPARVRDRTADPRARDPRADARPASRRGAGKRRRAR